MPSTRISMCLICACDSGATVTLNKSSSAIFVFTFSPFLKVRHPELPRHSKTDVAADRHKRCARRMRHVPIRSDPHMQAGTQAHVASDSSKHGVPTTAALTDSSNAVILHVEPSKLGAYEP